MGRKRVHSYREIVNAIFYLLRSGCAWRMLPHEFPPWKTVYHYFRLWRLTGFWERINASLRTELRIAYGRKPCLLYTSDAADEEDSVDRGGRRIIKKKKR